MVTGLKYNKTGLKLDSRPVKQVDYLRGWVQSFFNAKTVQTATFLALQMLYSCSLDQDIAPPTIFNLASWYWRQP